MFAPGQSAEGGSSWTRYFVGEDFPRTVTIGEASSPSIDEWDGLPLQLQVVAWTVGDWNVEVTCD